MPRLLADSTPVSEGQYAGILIKAGRQVWPVFPVPASIRDLSGWWDASDAATITQAAGVVSQWDDKSGGGFHVTQGTSAKRPLTNVTTINGRNVVTFDGVDDIMTRSGPNQLVNATTGEWSAFMATRPTDLSTGTRTIGALPTIAIFGRTSLTNFQAVAFDTTPTPFIDGPGAFTVTLGVARVHSSVRSPTTLETWADGVSNGPLATTGTPNTSPSAILQVGTTLFVGDLAELIVYARALTTTERQQVESYLKAKWGTA